MPPRVEYDWERVATFTSMDEVEELKEEEMCCARVRHTNGLTRCRLCPRDHAMLEIRMSCNSPDCKTAKPCRYKWKIWTCTLSEQPQVVVWYNGFEHNRGNLACSGKHKSKITPAMRAFILQKDECDVAPRFIWSGIREDPDVVEPVRGYPTLAQVTNCVKHLRRMKGTKNALQSVKELVSQHPYQHDGDPSKAFVFGAAYGDDGHPYIGKGTDDDSFIVGVTSRSLVEACLRYASPDHFTLFHADATFKLSDLAYPAITCGFTDASRTYQLAAIFIVSRRTANEYAACLQALVNVVSRVRPTGRLSIDAVMGDAEDAQFNAFSQVETFSSARFLMCFFHVLYNVKKRTRHQLPEHQKLVFEGILRLHYSESESEFYQGVTEVIAGWLVVSELHAFVKYFKEQWLNSRYWRWQIYHSPVGYATTNNPCESFNATLKQYTTRKRCYMQKLLKVTMQVATDMKSGEPVEDEKIIPAKPVVTRAAKAMIGTHRVAVYRTASASEVRVVQARKPVTSLPADLEDFRLAVDGRVAAEASAARALHDVGQRDDEDNLLLGAALVVRAERVKASALYKSIVDWGLLTAHLTGMPSDGWLVDVVKCTCPCKYFKKFRACAHVVIGRTAKALPPPGVVDKSEKLFSRVVRKAGASQRTSKKKVRVIETPVAGEALVSVDALANAASAPAYQSWPGRSLPQQLETHPAMTPASSIVSQGLMTPSPTIPATQVIRELWSPSFDYLLADENWQVCDPRLHPIPWDDCVGDRGLPAADVPPSYFNQLQDVSGEATNFFDSCTGSRTRENGNATQIPLAPTISEEPPTPVILARRDELNDSDLMVLRHPPPGRLPRASRAMDVQFILAPLT